MKYYDATNFPNNNPIEVAPWCMLGMMGYNELGSINPDELNQEQLREFGKRAVKLYWNEIPDNKKAKETPNFDSFIKQVFHDQVHGDVTEEFIYDLGFILAVYENSSQYNPQSLKEAFIAATQKMPAGKIPMPHTIGNPINNAAQDVSIFNWDIWKTTGKQTYDEYKVPIAMAIGGYAGYKILLAIGAILGGLALLKRKA